jgi:hypothetical protein
MGSLLDSQKPIFIRTNCQSRVKENDRFYTYCISSFDPHEIP